MTHAKREKDESAQIRAFRKAARELGADQSTERLQEVLRKIAKAKPSPKRTKHKPTN